MSDKDQETLDIGLTVEEARRLYPVKHPIRTDSRPLITTSFFIEGDDLDVDSCTNDLGLQPTRVSTTSIKGRWLPSGKVHVTRPQWVVERREQPSDDIDEELIKLLDTLWPRREALVAFLRKTAFDAGFTTSVTIFEDQPLYCLSPETLSRLTYFDVEWGLDIFDYRE